MELRRAEHHIYKLQYHLVWTPKYRRAAFAEPQRHDLKAVLEKVAFDHDIEMQEIEIPPDHVRALVALEPTMSVQAAGLETRGLAPRVVHTMSLSASESSLIVCHG